MSTIRLTTCRAFLFVSVPIFFSSGAAYLEANQVIAWGSNFYGQTNVPVNLTNPVAIAASYSHSLALRADGTVTNWGSYRLGDNRVPIFCPSDLTNVTAIAAGDSHDLVLAGDGSVRTWGYNQYGVLNIPAIATNVIAIAANYHHNLALRADGSVIGWGDATAPAGLSNNVVAIACGTFHNLALKADGSVVAWGYNYYGQATVPLGLSDVVAIAAGEFHSVALKANGTLIVWGSIPGSPGNPTNVVSIAAGGLHSLALKDDGKIIAWGSNANGESTVPASVTNVAAVAAGDSHNLALIGAGPPSIAKLPQTLTVAYGKALRFPAAGSPPLFYQWQLDGTNFPNGTNITLTMTHTGTYSLIVSNAFGFAVSDDVFVTIDPVVWATQPQDQSAFLGGGAFFEVSVNAESPWTCQWQFNGTDLPGETNTTLALANLRLNQAGYYALAITNNFGNNRSPNATLQLRRVEVWGNNNSGETNVPPGLIDALAAVSGSSHCLALKSNGVPIAWGSNSNGQTNVPPGATNLIALAAGDFHNLALRANGTVIGWGRTNEGQIPVPPGLSNVVAVAGGHAHSLVLESDGTVLGWGANDSGQIDVPPDLTNAVAIGCGSAHSVALTSAGVPVVWGNNDYGQTNVPADLTNVVSISSGASHILALRDDGTVIAWGKNDFGQTNTPLGLSNVIAITAGKFHSAALTSAGTVVSWGNNGLGQTNVPNFLTNITAISAGGSHTAALIGDDPPVLHAFASDPQWRANTFSVSIPTQSGRVYRLEYKNSLEEDNWIALPLLAGNGSTLSLINPGATNSQRFYRVRQW